MSRHRESIRQSSSPNTISVPPRLRATTNWMTAFLWWLQTRKSYRALLSGSSASWRKLSTSSGSNALRLRSHTAAGWTSGFSRVPSGPPPSLVPLLLRSPWRAHKIMAHPLLVSHTFFCFCCSHICWQCWKERIRAPASSGWVCGRRSLPAHGYRMEGEGKPSVQAVQSHICTRWMRLLSGWTSNFGATLYGCALGLPGHDAHQWGSRSGCSFTQGPEEHDRPGSTCHQSHRPSHRVFDIQPDSVGVPTLAHDDGD